MIQMHLPSPRAVCLHSGILESHSQVFSNILKREFHIPVLKATVICSPNLVNQDIVMYSFMEDKSPAQLKCRLTYEMFANKYVLFNIAAEVRFC